MVKLESVTTEYIDIEDRVRLTGTEGGKAVPMVLWLSQRLLQRLLPQLFKWLDQYHAGLQQRTQARQVQVQQRVTTEPPSQTLVLTASMNMNWMVTSINLSFNASAVQLTFKGSNEESAVLVMNAELLRKWLVILQLAYRKAEWPTTDWPKWITGDAAVKPGQRRHYHVNTPANA